MNQKNEIVGRVLRPSEGKQPLVYDYLDDNVGLLRHQGECRQKVFGEMSDNDMPMSRKTLRP